MLIDVSIYLHTRFVNYKNMVCYLYQGSIFFIAATFST